MLFAASSAVAGDLGVAARVGTLGPAVELDYRLTDHFSIRAHASDWSYDYDEVEDDIAYEGDVDLSTYGASLDWHPFGGAFRLSAGAYVNGNEINAIATGEGEYEIGDSTYISDADDPVRLNLGAELGSGTVPFFGLGWGNSPQNTGGMMFSFELGVLATGTPSITMSASGTGYDASEPSVAIDMSENAEVQAEIDQEIETLEEDISEFELWPVVMVGLGYRF